MNGKHIAKLGLTGADIGLALAAVNLRESAGLGRDEILSELMGVQASPADFLQGSYAALAASLMAKRAKDLLHAADVLLDQPLSYRIWGGDLIEPGALAQMNTAMRLPISRAGALMPDAHVGYGLPIGGVLATEGAVIPYGVGVDIGCSMRLSVFPLSPLGDSPGDRAASLDARGAVALLQKHTRFGAGVGWDKRERLDHQVLDDVAWDAQPLLRHLHDKAVSQLGTSGSGNHFAEFGTFTIENPYDGLDAGTYLALLTHSGSRGFGAQVAGHYTRLAESLHPALDPSAKKLAWLALDSQEGHDYWTAMTLAGQYAHANHEQIHARIAGALGEAPVLSVCNSHNLAWKQQVNGQELIVHRKGATPAAAGQLGLIPGSMADPAYLVRGRGLPEALESASHGAGRQMGRKAAEKAIARADWKAYLAERGVTLLGGGIDEAPQAYKRIGDVIAAQTDLVEVLAQFQPKVVRMDSGSEDI